VYCAISPIEGIQMREAKPITKESLKRFINKMPDGMVLWNAGKVTFAQQEGPETFVIGKSLLSELFELAFGEKP
jgi:hypothetical protein